jgi:hypothetical protein
MRTLALAVSLLLALTAAAAEHQYILPMAGYSLGHDGTSLYAYIVVTNLSPRPATIRPTNVYPFAADRPCAAPASIALGPHERMRISPMICMDRVSAIEIVSDEPLSIRTELDTKRWAFGSDRQIIPAPTQWIAADVPSVTEAIIRDDSQWRANLLLINPADSKLVVHVQVDRPEVSNSATHTFEVAPRTSRIVNIPEVRRVVPTAFISSGEGRHILTITANGPYQAGMSSVSYGISMYVPATPLAP